MGNLFRDNIYNEFPDPNKKIEELGSQVDEKADRQDVDGVVKKTKGIINVKEYGAIGDGLSHPLSQVYTTLAKAQIDFPQATALTDEIDWCAFSKAATLGALTGYTTGKGVDIYAPYGKYILNKQLALKNVSLKGDPHGTELRFSNVGSNISSLTIDRDNGQRQPRIKDLVISGDGFWQLGTQTTLIDGVEIKGQARPYFENVFVRYFNKGMVWNNDVGHIRYKNCTISENYIGVYCKKNSGDYAMIHTDVNQNNFANFATNASTGIEGLRMKDGHCGFAPFAFYCEPAPSQAGGKNFFLWDVVLETRFEQIGNAVIFSDYTQSANPMVRGVKINTTGFSWDIDKANKFTLGNFPRDYAIDIARLESGDFEVFSDSYPLTKGVVGVMRVRSQVSPSQISIIGKGSKKSDVTIDSGTPAITAGVAYAMKSYDGMVKGDSFGVGSSTLVTNNGTLTTSFLFENNANKRGVYLIYADTPSLESSAMVFSTGSGLKVMFAGTDFAVAATNPATAGKFNIYLSGVNIAVQNLYGSDRRIAVVPFSFY